MPDRRAHTLHRGEKSIQTIRGTPKELTQAITSYIHTDMNQQHAEFFSELPYLPLTTLDNAKVVLGQAYW